MPQIQRDVLMMIVNDSSFRNETTPGDTQTHFKGVFNEVCQVLDYKKDPWSDSKFEQLLTNFLTKMWAEQHQKNQLNNSESTLLLLVF